MNNLSMTIFEFEMRNIEIEKEMIHNIVNERYNRLFVNEENILYEGALESIKDFIVKIFDNICELITKAILSIRKKFQTIKFDKAKKRIEELRKSTKEPGECNFKIEIPNANLMNSSSLKDIDVSITGIRKSGNMITIENTDFVNSIKNESSNGGRKNKSKNFAEKYVLATFNNTSDEKTSFNEYIKKTKQIDINKSNCRNNLGEIEKQYASLDGFMKNDFSKCIDQLVKIKQDSRKMSIYANSHKLEFTLGMDNKTATNILRSSAYAYSQVVKLSIQYLFQVTSLHIKCLNENINKMSGVLL